MKRAALLSFAVAGIAGLALAVAVGPELLVVGAAAIAAGWFYTGGSHPYGYYGLGELFVFVFFGVVATAGSTYVQVESLTALSLVASVPVGLLATALLVDQQPPRHPRRHRVRQADARRAARRRPHPLALRRHARRRLRCASRWWRAGSIGRPAAAALVGIVLARRPVLQVLEGASRTGAHPRARRHRPGPARHRRAPRRSGSGSAPDRVASEAVVGRATGWTRGEEARPGCSRWAA